jgi:hypothetical protein
VSKFWDKRTVGPIKAIHPMTGKIIEVDPQKDSFIGSDLDISLRRLPGLLSWYMALRDRAKARLRDAKHEEHNAEEDVYAEIRERNPKVTETTVKMAVKKDPRMRKAFRERMDAEDMYQKLSSAVESISEKRWSLQALVKNAAIERGTKDSM